MKKVLSIMLSLILVVSVMTIVPVMAADEVVSTVKLAGTSVNPTDPVNIILTDKANSKIIKYINQVKPDEDGSWRLNFQIEGTLGDYNILFRQNNTVTSEIGPEFIASITSGMEINLSAIVAARTVVANLNVANPDLEDTSCNVIIATYDANDNFIDAISPKVVIDEETIAEEITHNMPQTAAYAKVFCWYDFIEPLTKAQTVKPMTKYIENRGSVGNVFTKLENGENVDIVFLGGSVTVGTGVDWTEFEQKSWRGLASQWFKAKYPGQVTTHNSGYGGTGSFFGAIRTAKDVLAYNPDLVFIMYPINDLYDGMTKEETQRQMEDIIWQIRQADSETDIIMGYDTDKYVGATEGNYDMVTWQEEVAEAYDISIINMGLRVADYVRDTGVAWSTLLTDQVHPNASGYRLYADVALSFLEEGRLNAPDTVSDYVLPAQRTYGTEVNSYFVKSADNFISGKETVNNGNSLYTKKYQLAPGETVSFNISGESVGVVVKQIYAYDIDLSYDIDGSTGTTDVGNKQVIKLKENCSLGEHAVKLTNDSETTIEIIGAFTWNAE